jgi:hypothetical protein
MASIYHLMKMIANSRLLSTTAQKVSSCIFIFGMPLTSIFTYSGKPPCKAKE